VQKLKPKVSIIILNWNGWRDTIECLESLFQIDYPNYDVILIDNNSEDDSLRMIKKYCYGELEVVSDFFKYNRENKPLNIREYTNSEIGALKLINGENNSLNNDIILIENDQNFGFAEGNNIGIKYALKNLHPKYILLLNNDTVVDEKFLSELIYSNEKRDNIGFSGPKTYYYNCRGSLNILDNAGGKINLWKGESISLGVKEFDNGQYNSSMIVDYIQGSCMLVKSEVFWNIGFFNPKFFTFWEESDLCMRGLKNGYKSLYVPNGKIWHKSGASSFSTDKTYYITRNRFWFVREHGTLLQYIVFILYFFGYKFWISVASYSIYQNDFNLLKVFLKAIYNGLTDTDY
jgi:GT2 family glycosyltransferase